MWRATNTIGPNWMRGILLLGLIACVSGLLVSIDGLHDYFSTDRETALLFSLGIPLSVAYAAFLIRLSEGKRKGPARWRINTIHIANPKEMEALPSYVRGRIKDVREFAPDATFSIEKLIQGMWVLDPIVRAHFKSGEPGIVIAIFDENDGKVF
jgi:hypothetical protein